MSRQITLDDGRAVDLRYFVEWRPYLWLKPVQAALAFLGDLRGKCVLEIGGRSGRMASLFALLGASVTMLEKGSCDGAIAETHKWGVASRVRAIVTQGGFSEVRDQSFDVIFTKSVLWSIEDLAELLDQVCPLLAEGGQVAFLENARGGTVLDWLRRRVFHRRDFTYRHYYHGIRPSQLGLFRERFADVRASRHRWLVYQIFGHRKAGP